MDKLAGGPPRKLSMDERLRNKEAERLRNIEITKNRKRRNGISSTERTELSTPETAIKGEYLDGEEGDHKSSTALLSDQRYKDSKLGVIMKVLSAVFNGAWFFLIDGVVKFENGKFSTEGNKLENAEKNMNEAIAGVQDKIDASKLEAESMAIALAEAKQGGANFDLNSGIQNYDSQAASETAGKSFLPAVGAVLSDLTPEDRERIAAETAAAFVAEFDGVAQQDFSSFNDGYLSGQLDAEVEKLAKNGEFIAQLERPTPQDCRDHGGDPENCKSIKVCCKKALQVKIAEMNEKRKAETEANKVKKREDAIHAKLQGKMKKSKPVTEKSGRSFSERFRSRT